jgi:hypothetical protein
VSHELLADAVADRDERLLLTPEERKDAEWFTELLNARGTGTFTTEDARERIDAMTVTIETAG